MNDDVNHLTNDEGPGLPYRLFDPRSYYAERRWLVGSGGIGGKAKGFAFSHAALQDAGLEGEVRLPDKTYVLTTELFEEFMDRNDLWERVHSTRDANQIQELFLNGRFDDALSGVVGKILDDIGGPLSVRSSSLLEDDVHLAFAGKYTTCFAGNVGSPSDRVDEVLKAVRVVYASTFDLAAREYRRKHGIPRGTEKMGVLLQTLAGGYHDGLFYPEIAGTGFSKVTRRPSPRINKDDGLVRLCFGLGTRTVDRSFARTYYLTNPALRPDGTRPADIASRSQEKFDAIDLESGKLVTKGLEEKLAHVQKHHKMAQTYVQIFDGTMFHWIHADRDDMPFSRHIFTFEDFPRRFPQFFERVKKLFALFECRSQLPVDLEFTYETAGDSFTLVQMRPLAIYKDLGRVLVPDGLPEDKVLLRASNMIANGKIEGTRHLVYVDPDLYGKDTSFYEVARAVGEINEHLDGERYILVGPGRWGSSNPALGVPTRYGEISNAGCLVELGLCDKGMCPELSYGTHFFLDLDGDNILYMPVFEGMEDNTYNKRWFESAKWVAGGHPAVRHYEGTFDVFLDGETENGVVLAR